jgi:beta-phosphoglucomutase-like phosphatase (HAD superfamily)
MGKPGLVIFDCDGVLVDSMEVAFSVSRDMAAELGITLTFEGHERYFGMRDSDMFNDLAERHGVTLPEDFLDRVEARKMTRYREGVPMVTGALHAVRRIAEAGVPLCVASSATLERTRVKLAPVGLLDYFGEHVFTGYDVPKGKPAPDLFLLAAQTMGFAPGDCVVVEDAAAGVQAAMAAGMRVLGYAPKSDSQGLSDLGAEVFVSMAEVPELVGI